MCKEGHKLKYASIHGKFNLYLHIIIGDTPPKDNSLATLHVMTKAEEEFKNKASASGHAHTSPSADHDRRAKYPDVEERLYREYRDLRRKGLRVKGWWFHTKTKQIFKELHVCVQNFVQPDYETINFLASFLRLVFMQ